jgi:hypothetical protein
MACWAGVEMMAAMRAEQDGQRIVTVQQAGQIESDRRLASAAAADASRWPSGCLLDRAANDDGSTGHVIGQPTRRVLARESGTANT